ncbi:MAG: N-acetylmuramic acid 6-phosphate etherase [Candidatus Zixiibacteriota bacterium]|nr:MAG: N-acetylmuramic acid 6-phosphate etherase [candidate division Zixibacteria bacterium]
MSNKNHKSLIAALSGLATEQLNPNTIDIDDLSPLEICRKINAEDHKVAGIIEKALPLIAEAAAEAARTWKNGGRIVYIGAGTSGRLGVLDAAECPPTFGTDPAKTIGLISGGYDTLVLSIEGAEDKSGWAIEDLKRIELNHNDFLIGIAASVRTPYTNAGVEYGRSVGCKTALIVCNEADILKTKPDILIPLPVGPEVITGSTRMKSGTAQKMTLNMITTTAAVLSGKTYGNLMVDLQARSDKLAARSRKILMDFLKIGYGDADRLLKNAAGSVKTAIVMKKCSVAKPEAERLLRDAKGFLRRVIG